MRRTTFLRLRALLFSLCSAASWQAAHAAPQSQAVINGEDNRRDDAHTAVVVLMWSHRLAFTGDDVTLRAPTAQAAFDLCVDEPFSQQPAAGYCSGIFVAADTIITAAHCLGETIELARDRCRRTWIVRSFIERQPAVRVRADDVFACADVIAFNAGGDLAVLVLDRPLQDDPSAIRPAPARVTSGDALTVWSHPSGLPLKRDEHATVVAAPDGDTFTAAADAFEGSSGGLATNVQGELAGMVLRGSTDWALDGRCQRAARTTEPSETFLHAEYIERALCGTAPLVSAFCGMAPAPPPPRASTCGDQICARDERRLCAADCARYRNVPATWLDDPKLWPEPITTERPTCSMRPHARSGGAPPLFSVAVAIATLRRRRRARLSKVRTCCQPEARLKGRER